MRHLVTQRLTMFISAVTLLAAVLFALVASQQ